MHPVEIKDTLATLTILFDSREKDTPALRNRLNATGRPVERVALTSGDYSCKIVLPDGTGVSLADKLCVERKMGADEITQNFTKHRDRFVREFERFKALGGKPYLLIENTSWEDIINHKYRSKLDPNAFIASLMAWQARYGTHVLFCKPETTGYLIERVFYYEVKEMLERGDFG